MAEEQQARGGATPEKQPAQGQGTLGNTAQQQGPAPDPKRDAKPRHLLEGEDGRRDK